MLPPDPKFPPHTMMRAGLLVAAVGAVCLAIGRLAIEDGYFLLWRQGESKPALSAPAHLPNFLPGYRLIQSRLYAISEADGVIPTPA